MLPVQLEETDGGCSNPLAASPMSPKAIAVSLVGFGEDNPEYAEEPAKNRSFQVAEQETQGAEQNVHRFKADVTPLRG